MGILPDLRGRRVSLVVLGGLAAAIGLGVLSQLPSGGGPLIEPGSSTTGWHLPEGRTAAWAMTLPETTTEIELRWIKPGDVVGLEVLGIVVSRVPFADFNATIFPVFTSFGVNSLIAKFLFDVNSSTGYDGGTLITTKTGTNQFAGEAVLGQSNGYLAGPASC